MDLTGEEGNLKSPASPPDSINEMMPTSSSPVVMMETETSEAATDALPQTLEAAHNSAPANLSSASPYSFTLNASSTLTSIPQSPLHHTSMLMAPPSPKTPPCHNKSPTMCKNKLYFALQVIPTALPNDQKATATLKLEAYHQGAQQNNQCFTSY